ncbi:MAG TPA: tetratricopeptide repeat protein [Thermoanaerobaculia bacterium]|nr:tetratricopeptide repeat protein [Thermoanaerobaculia bacterium]
MSGRILPFRHRPLSSEAGIEAAKKVLATPLDERIARARALHLDDPETLLALCGMLRERMASAPASALEEVEFLYRFIEAPKREIGLFDERDYFLGETALLAGTACRCLSRREEAWIWFDRAEAGYRHTMNAPAELSRLSYQRLAERFEERQLDLVIELLPSLVESFHKLGMTEDALKCRFLEGLALYERDEPAASIEVFNFICREAEALGSHQLLAESYVNLIQAHAILGEAEAAIEASRRAIPLLRELDNRIALAKVQWGLATLLRQEGRTREAIDCYRTAQEDFESIGMRADIAALNLVVADLLLEEGRSVEALREISEALPVISELKMAPEGMAALTLVRESVRRQEVNRQALRELHGYFQELQN